MEKKLLTTRTIFVISAIVIAAFMRLIPHWPNFTPVAAIALFGGAYLNRKALAFLIPVAAMLISDLFLGFHSAMLAVYAALIITVFIGLRLGKNVKAGYVGIASLSSSVIFFLITNFASWMMGAMPYSRDFSGLMQAYVAGIPFFNNGVLGDLFYSTILFGGFYLVSKRYPSLAKA